MEELRPDLAEEWHPTKNGSLNPSMVSKTSGQTVWWLCKNCGNEWQSAVSNRFNGNGCPKCAHAYQTSEPEQAVLYYLSQFFPDLISPWKPDYLKRASVDIYIPSINLAIEYDGGVWHKDRNRDLKKSKLLEENGVRLVRIRENHAPQISDNSFQIESTKTSANLTVLNSPIKKLFEYINSTFSLNHVPDINIARDYNAIVASMSERKRKRSFINTHPELLQQWDFEKNTVLPEYVAAGSNEKAWWKCEKGHSWSAVVASRSKGIGCPYCSGKKVIIGKTDLATTSPGLLAIWNYERNNISPETLSAHSNKTVWWKCKKCGYEWQNSPNQQGALGCLACNSKRRVIPGHTDFGTVHPDLLCEWDFEKNKLLPSEVSKSSNRVVWWKCKYGHEWEASIHSRVSAKGCPYCSGKRLLPGVNDLATKRPILAEKWDNQKNDNISPNLLFPSTDKKYWWKCPYCGYEWFKSPNGMLSDCCPMCKK